MSGFAIEWGVKSLVLNAAIFALCCSEILYQMQSEIDALKDKARWRKQSEEPAPKNQLVEVCESAKDGYIDSTYGFGVEDWTYWRPLDLPEMGETK